MPDALSVAEWEALLEAAGSWRDRFLLVLLRFSGLRIGETLGLRQSDLHFVASSTSLVCKVAGAHLHVVRRDNANRASSKSRDARAVPVGQWVLAYYDRYLEERLEYSAADGGDFVFVNLFHPPLGAPMTDSAVRQLFERLGRRAGLDRRVHPHMTRHLAGTELAEAGVAIDVIQALLGHRRITSTQIYTRPSGHRMREAVEAVETASIQRRVQRDKGGQR